MQHGHNLENAWVTCLITSSAHQRLDNHGVRHVCMTPIYLKILTIIVCHMQLEETKCSMCVMEESQLSYVDQNMEVFTLFEGVHGG